MKSMNRRNFIKISSSVGAWVFVSGLPSLKTGKPVYSYFLVTDNPVRDSKSLLHTINLNLNIKPQVESFPIQPSNQDLGIIKNGSLLDPTNTDEIPEELKSFTFKLRSRKTKGNYLVSIEEFQKVSKDIITFFVNGRMVNQVNPEKDYSCIVIEGEQGNTVFRFINGKLSVRNTSCRNQICQKTGGIRTGKIICAPNKLVATINQKQPLIDGITG